MPEHRRVLGRRRGRHRHRHHHGKAGRPVCTSCQTPIVSRVVITFVKTYSSDKDTAVGRLGVCIAIAALRDVIGAYCNHGAGAAAVHRCWATRARAAAGSAL